MFKFLDHINNISNILVVVIVFLSFIAGVSAYIFYGKDNEVTHLASEVIQHETGIDIERILPDASTSTP